MVSFFSVSKYQDKEQIECCLDGMKDVPVPYICERRRDYIVGGPGCAEAFLHCCKEMEKVHVDRKVEALKLARSKRWGLGMGKLFLGRSRILVYIFSCMLVFKNSFSSYKKYNSTFWSHLLDELDDDYIDSYEISVRTSFPESWLWINFTLPNCTQNITNW